MPATTPASWNRWRACPSIFRSAKALAPGRGYRVGPSAIGMRMNPYGAGTVANPGNARIAMAMEDPRQRGLINAAWTLGYSPTRRRRRSMR